jgi:tryptophan-rich sensory protein
MTITEQRTTAASSDVVRQVGVLLSAVVGIVVAFLGSGAVVGTPVAEIADGALATDATLVSPAGGAFAIWSIIYFGLAAYAVFQLAPSRRADPRQRQVGWWVAASLLLNALWVVFVQLEWIAASVPVIVALLVVLVVVLIRLGRSTASSTVETVLVDGTTGLYLGWVCIATVANTASALVFAGVDAQGGAATTWAVLVLAVAGGVGALLALTTGGRLAPALSLAWGLAWVAVARTEAPVSDAVALAAALAAVVTLGSAVAVRVTRRSQTTPA